MDDSFYNDIHHLQLAMHLADVRREATAERAARALLPPGRWRNLLSRLLVWLGTVLITTGEALQCDPAPVGAER
jgi:hypothetical protein